METSRADYLQRRDARVAELRQTLNSRFPEPDSLVFEPGCGHGHYLTALAEAHPETPCLGIDIVSKRITKAKAKVAKRQLPNLLFLKAEVRECLEALPAYLSFARTFILFPDPWPKKRHAKHRMIQPDILDLLAGRAAECAPLHFRTDDEGMFAWGLDQISAHPDWEIDDELPWPFEHPSFFQDLAPAYFSLSAKIRRLS